MDNKNQDSQENINGSNMVLFDLKLKAANIKNCYLVKDSINALNGFINTQRYGCAEA